MPTRLAPSPAAARACLLALLALVAWGLLADATPPGGASVHGESDLDFYRAVVERVRAGEAYHGAAAAELAARGWALHPFPTFRLPTLAVFLASPVGEAIASPLLAVLALGALLAWLRRLLPGAILPVAAMTAAFTALGLGFLALIGEGDAGKSPAVMFHETWASALIALSLALRTDRAWLPSVLLGLTAALIREHSLAYLAVMAAMAAWEGRRTEALGWAAAIGAFALALAAHAVLAHQAALGAGSASADWLQLGGWSFVLTTARWSLVLMALPGWAIAVLVPLALLGLASWRDALGRRVALTVAAYMGAFLVVGKPDNHYWGLMYGQLLALGLLFSGPALAGLVARALPGRPAPSAGAEAA